MYSNYDKLQDMLTELSRFIDVVLDEYASDGYTNGYDEGKADGYKEGYDDGYQQRADEEDND
jgi:hypothetical protein